MPALKAHLRTIPSIHRVFSGKRDLGNGRARAVMLVLFARSAALIIRAEVVERLPVEKLHGVGPATAAKMNRLGIKTGFDLKEQTLAFLQQHFGKPGPYYFWLARGIDEGPVRADRIRKSLGAETFSADIFTFEAACEALQPIIEKV